MTGAAPTTSWPVSHLSLDPAAAATRVTYPAGDIRSTGTVVGLARMSGATGEEVLGVVLDVTAAHPLSPTWPDQPADRGTLRSTSGVHLLIDVRQGVLHDGMLTVDVAAPRVPGTDVVVHLVDASAAVALGDRVEVAVDPEWRRALSLAHSACHLSALALDAALAPYWTKPAAPDPLGNPAFDQIAIQSSMLHPLRAVDVYRLGKSLRKRGFDAVRFAHDPDPTARVHADTMTRWVEQNASSPVDTGDGTLTARRSWRSTVDGIDVAIPCGGTHVASTGELAGIAVEYQLADALDQLTVTTTVPAT